MSNVILSRSYDVVLFKDDAAINWNVYGTDGRLVSEGSSPDEGRATEDIGGIIRDDLRAQLKASK